MNSITSDPIKGLNAKKNFLKSRIVEYLNRVNIVDDSTTLILLYETTKLLKTLQTNEAKHTVNVHFKSMNLELKTILMSMQTFLKRLEKETDSVKYSKMTARRSISTRAEQESKKHQNKNIREIRNLIIIIENEKKKTKIQILSTKKLMKRIQESTKSVREITRLTNEILRVQTKSTQTRKILQNNIN
jgi:hypothetical protein